MVFFLSKYSYVWVRTLCLAHSGQILLQIAGARWLRLETRCHGRGFRPNQGIGIEREGHSATQLSPIIFLVS